MATRNRLPGSSDLMAAAYWGGSAPVSGDTAKVENCGDTFSSNLLNPTVDLAALFVSKTSRANFGDRSAGTYIQFDVDRTATGILTNYGSGDYFGLAAGSGTATINRLINNPANLRQLMVVNSGAITTLEQAAGFLRLGSAVTGTTAEIMGGDVVSEYHATNAIATINMYAGQFLNSKDWTTLNLYGGTFIWDDQYNGLTGGVVNILGPSARFVWRNGNVGNLTLAAGTWDMSQIRKAGLSAGAVVTYANAKEIKAPASDLVPTESSRNYKGGGASFGSGDGSHD
mgnify:CR=1 FL=1